MSAMHSPERSSNDRRSERSYPLRPARSNQSIQTTKSSVQDRLKAAVEKPVSEVYYDKFQDDKAKENAAPDRKTSSPVSTQASSETLKNEIDELASSLESAVNLSEPQSDVIEEALSKMIKMRHFKRYAPPQESELDSDGFSLVAVSNVDKKEDGSVVFWFQPYEYQEDYENFKKTLELTYNSDDIPIIENGDIPKFKNHLIMAVINGAWVRAQIIGFAEPDIYTLEDIDSGNKALSTSRNVVKIPLDAELQKPAFALRAILENLEDDSSIEEGDLIKIRIIYHNNFGACLAEARVEHDQVDMEAAPVNQKLDQNENEMQALPATKEPAATRLYLDQIQAKGIHAGSAVKLAFLDGSRLDKGELHVCESLPENISFYNKLRVEIEEFIAGKRERYEPV